MDSKRKALCVGLMMVILVSLATHPVGVQAATPAEIEQAIDDGLAYLATAQNGDGSWGVPGYLPAKTCLILAKFEERAYELGYDSPFDPAYAYRQTVVDGWTYILTGTVVLSQDLSPQPAGDPDGNGNGLGLYVYGEAGHTTYATGICLMALAASGTPSRENEGGLDWNGDGSPDSYLEIAQEMVDWLAFGQADEPGAYRGGWSYGARDNDGGSGDQSNAGFATLGLSYAGNFGATVPGWVKAELSLWIDAIQDDTTGCAHYELGDNWFNIYKQGHVINQMVFAGDDPATSARLEAALDCAEGYWRDASVDPGWGYSLPGPADYLAMYSITKGLGNAGLDLIDTDGDGQRDDDWHNQEPPRSPPDDLASVLVGQQSTGGSWPAYCAWGNGEAALCTAWALFALEKSHPERPAVDVRLIKSGAPDPALPGKTLTYTLTVANEGQLNATGLVLTDTLPAEVTYVENDAGCSHDTGTVTCDLGDLAAGTMNTMHIVVTIDAGFSGTLLNEAQVWPVEEDAHPANNVAQASTEVMVDHCYVPDVDHLAGSMSSIQIVNVGEQAAAISISYYDMTGSLVREVDDSVAPHSANGYVPIHPDPGFDGAAVIAYAGQVATVADFAYLAPLTTSSYQGFAGGNDHLHFPLIMKNNNYNVTTFNVQNVTAQPVDVRIEFIPEPGMGYDPNIPVVTDTLPAWTAHAYDQRTMPGFAGVGKWVGSAHVAVLGEGQVTGVAQQIDELRQTATAYGGFLQGASEVDMPLIMDANNHMWTSVNCQNLGPGETDVTVEYYPEAGYPPKPTETKTGVLEYGAAIFLQSPFVEKWVGAAHVSAGNELACINNQTNLPFSYASAYEGFDAPRATNLTAAPIVEFRDQGDGHNLWTGINIQNLGNLSTTVTLDFLPSAGYVDLPDEAVDIEPGAVGVILFYDPYGDGSDAIGGAAFTSDNDQPLAAVINRHKVEYLGDVYATYVGVDK